MVAYGNERPPDAAAQQVPAQHEHHDGNREAEEIQPLVRIERQLERFLVRQGVGLFRADPLSVASLIAYFWAKYNEITNIRIISRCKTADFPVEHLKEELVYV